MRFSFGSPSNHGVVLAMKTRGLIFTGASVKLDTASLRSRPRQATIQSLDVLLSFSSGFAATSFYPSSQFSPSIFRVLLSSLFHTLELDELLVALAKISRETYTDAWELMSRARKEREREERKGEVTSERDSNFHPKSMELKTLDNEG